MSRDSKFKLDFYSHSSGRTWNRKNFLIMFSRNSFLFANKMLIKTVNHEWKNALTQMFKLSFVMLVKIHSDDSDNDGERNPTAPECFCWWGVEASAMAFDSRGSTHRALKNGNRTSGEHSEIGKKIFVSEILKFVIFSTPRWKTFPILWANFVQNNRKKVERWKIFFKFLYGSRR